MGVRLPLGAQMKKDRIEVDKCPYVTSTGETCGARTPWESGIGYDWCGAYAESKPLECPLGRWVKDPSTGKIKPNPEVSTY